MKMASSSSRVGSPPALPGAHHRGRAWEPSQGSHFNEATPLFLSRCSAWRALLGYTEGPRVRQDAQE